MDRILLLCKWIVTTVFYFTCIYQTHGSYICWNSVFNVLDTLGHSLTLPIANYLTEDINGDVCESDLFSRSFILTDKVGEQRFSHEENTEPWFLPNAVVTDILGHIIVCDGYENTVHFPFSLHKILKKTFWSLYWPICILR